MEVRDVTSESVLLYVDHCHKAPAVILCVHRFVLTLTVLMSTKVDVNASIAASGDCRLQSTFEGVVRYVAIAGRKSVTSLLKPTNRSINRFSWV